MTSGDGGPTVTEEAVSGPSGGPASGAREAAAEMSLASAPPAPETDGLDEVVETLTARGDLPELLASVDQAGRTALYQALGLTIPYRRVGDAEEVRLKAPDDPSRPGRRDDVEDVEGDRLGVLVVMRPWTRTATSSKWARPFGVTTTNSTSGTTLPSEVRQANSLRRLVHAPPAQNRGLTREGLTYARQRCHSPVVT